VSYQSFNNLFYIFGLDKINLDFPLWIEQPGSSTHNEFRWLISFEFNLDRNFVF